MGTTTIVLADDHRMIRAGLRSLIESEPGIEVVGEAEDGRAAVQLVRELSPDVVLMDVRMPDLNGIEATRLALRAKPDVKVVVLSAYSDERTARAVLEAGACGFVVKDSAFEELAAAIRSVTAGQVYLSPMVAQSVRDERAADVAAGAPSGNAETRANPTVFDRLTSREREVLQLIAEGKSTKEAAVHLHLSVKTIETHRRSIMEKLDLQSVAELTKYAIREGLTSPD